MQITPLKHYKQIQLEERVTLVSLHFQKFTVREIARTLCRSPSTITRALDRNSIGGHYASKRVQACTAERSMQGCPEPKLHNESNLFVIDHHLLCLKWSPEQISMTLSATYPKGHEHRVHTKPSTTASTPSPWASSSVFLIKALRQAHNKRVPRRKGQDRRGQIPDMLSIHVSPPEVEDLQFPGHWEGDLIKCEAIGSAVGTMVEHTSRLLMLVKLPKIKPASALNVMQGFTDKLLSIALPLRLSMTYDQGREMAMHKELGKRTGIAVYFCDPRSPWQRGSNESMNGLVRQYLPMGTDLFFFTANKNWMQLQMKSTTAHEKVWGYDRRCLFTGNCS